MDLVGLQVLCCELREDASVMREAAATASRRLGEDHPGHLEACAYELNRSYNVLERGFERICVAFENHFEKRGDYHQRLIERISLDIPGFRPAFLSAQQRMDAQELKGFRHVFRHAYDLRLREDRLAELVEIASRLSEQFPEMIDAFESRVADLLAA